MSDSVDNYLAHMGIEMDDELKHYGVKGMRWGKRKAEGSTRGERRASRKAAREKEDQEIVDARVRQGERANALERQAFKTYAADGEKALKRAMNKYDRMEVDLLTNPDAATAAKATHGEKVAAGIIAGVYGTMFVAGVGLAVANGVRR